jgi:hypothetical protein
MPNVVDLWVEATAGENGVGVGCGSVIFCCVMIDAGTD